VAWHKPGDGERCGRKNTSCKLHADGQRWLVMLCKVGIVFSGIRVSVQKLENGCHLMELCVTVKPQSD